MIEVINKKSYHRSLFGTALWILGAFIITLFLDPSLFAGAFIFCVILELILFSEKFTQSVSVDDMNITVIYYHFFSKKEIVIRKTETKAKLSKTKTLRSSIYWVLDIMQHNKRIYRIDSRDGFNEDDLRMLENNIRVPN